MARRRKRERLRTELGSRMKARAGKIWPDIVSPTYEVMLVLRAAQTGAAHWNQPVD